MLFLLNPQLATIENAININVLALSGRNFHFFYRGHSAVLNEL
jgi:hypothetical protein